MYNFILRRLEKTDLRFGEDRFEILASEIYKGYTFDKTCCFAENNTW